MTTFEYNLVPCSQSHQAQLRMLPDLTHNLGVAQAIVNRIAPFFLFELPWPTFSGHARAADRNDGRDPPLYVQVVEGSAVIRSFAFRGIGFVGVLNVDVRGHFVDHLEALEDGLRVATRSAHDGWAEQSLGLVVEGELLVGIRV